MKSLSNILFGVCALLAAFLILFPAPVAPAKSVKTPRPTSQPLTIHNSAELNKLPNKLNDRTIFVVGGDYDFSPRLIQWQRVVLCPTDNRAVVFNVAKKDADRWLFTADPSTYDVEIRDIHAALPDITGGFLVSTGGSNIRLVRTQQNQGNLFWGHGGGEILLDHCTVFGTAKKYLICNFDNQLDGLTVKGGTFRQGKEEAAIRLMQVFDAEIDDANFVGSHYKQAVQDRPGGFARKDSHGKLQRDSFGEHVWNNCTITGGVDCGNFKLATDRNFPFGTLGVSRWINCKIDAFATTAQGANPLTFDQMGVKRVEFVNTKLGGKLTNKTITK
jgi:hypothetical protein